MAKIDPPLWEVMRDAAISHLFEANPDLPVVNARIAAELRAIADRVTPEEKVFISDSYGLVLARWDERRRIRALLLAEADKAEAEE